MHTDEKALVMTAVVLRCSQTMLNVASLPAVPAPHHTASQRQREERRLVQALRPVKVWQLSWNPETPPFSKWRDVCNLCRTVQYSTTVQCIVTAAGRAASHMNVIIGWAPHSGLNFEACGIVVIEVHDAIAALWAQSLALLSAGTGKNTR